MDAQNVTPVANTPVEPSETPVEQTAPPAPSEQPSAQAAPLLPIKVAIFDVHSGSYAEFPAKNMSEAIDHYKRINAAARVDRPFTTLDDLNWIAVHKFRGGKVRVVAITNTEKVFGRAGGLNQLNRDERRQGVPNTTRPSLPAIPALT